MKKNYLIINILLVFTFLNFNSSYSQEVQDLLLGTQAAENHIKNDEDLFSINFLNASLRFVLKDFESILNVNFMPDDIIKDGINQQQQPRDLDNIKITYTANKQLNKKEAWSLLSQLLSIADLSTQPVPGVDGFYRITTSANANRLALPLYIGTNPNELPEKGRLRYIYFLANTTAPAMRAVVEKIKSSSATVEIFKDLNALIITDEAYNIASIMKIVKELDDSTTPETMSIVRLNQASAQEVAQLYENLKGKDDPFKRTFGQKDLATKYYFSQEVRVIAESRTNSLIILGPKDGVERIEKFISEYVDTDVSNFGQKLFTVKLQFSNATQLATTLTSVTKFGQGTEVAQVGGVRAGERYFSNVTFQADNQTNSLLIMATEEDMKLLRPVIKKLDVQQPQVALEILVVNVDYSIIKRMGTAIRNPFPGAVNFQSLTYNTTQSQAIINENTGSLLGNLIDLASTSSPGSFVLSLGRESVWALFNIQEEINNAHDIAHPFLTTVNKYPASVLFSSERRVKSATIASGFTTQDEVMSLPAKLEVTVTPQISSDGTINLDVQVTDETFTNEDPNDGNKLSRIVKTNADVKNGQALAIGGICRTVREAEKDGPAPFISNIPILGNLFTARRDLSRKNNLLILIFPTIIETGAAGQNQMNKFTHQKSSFLKDIIDETECAVSSPRDPIYQWFFNTKNNPEYNFEIDNLNDIVKQSSKQAHEVKKAEEPKSVLDWIGK